MTQRRLSQKPRDSIHLGNIEIRPYVVDDAQAVMDVVSENIEHLRPWMPWIQFEPLDLKARQELIEQWTQSWDNLEDFTMGIFENGRLVGGTGLHLRGADGTVDIGYWLARGSVGQGLMTRTATALLDVAFEIDEVSVVFVSHDRANKSSQRIPERLSFELVSTSARQKEAPGEDGVVLQWMMTRDRWNNLRRG